MPIRNDEPEMKPEYCPDCGHRLARKGICWSCFDRTEQRRDAKAVARIMTHGSQVADRYLHVFVKGWRLEGKRPFSRYLPS
jgi:hypothetical protein